MIAIAWATMPASGVGIVQRFLQTLQSFSDVVTESEGGASIRECASAALCMLPSCESPCFRCLVSWEPSQEGESLNALLRALALCPNTVWSGSKGLSECGSVVRLVEGGTGEPRPNSSERENSIGLPRMAL